jgi:hypothetical protein
VWPDLLARQRVNSMDAPIEDNGTDHLVRGRIKDLAQRAERDLGDNTLVDLPDLWQWPGRRFHYLAGLDVPKRFLLRNDFD